MLQNAALLSFVLEELITIAMISNSLLSTEKVSM